MAVSTSCQEYDESIDEWTKINNVLAGNAQQYIHNIRYCYSAGHSQYYSPSNVRALDACRRYREMGVLSNFALQTVQTIVGLATNSPPVEFELPAELEYLRTSCTPTGLSFDQLLHNILYAQTSIGRCGIFTDFPQIEGDLTAERRVKENPQAKINFFNAQAGINWRTTVINGQQALNLVVIPKSVENC